MGGGVGVGVGEGEPEGKGVAEPAGVGGWGEPGGAGGLICCALDAPKLSAAPLRASARTRIRREITP